MNSDIAAVSKQTHSYGVEEILSNQKTKIEYKNYTEVNSIYRWNTIHTGCIPLSIVNIAYGKSIDEWTGEKEIVLTGKTSSNESQKINISATPTEGVFGHKLECTGGIVRFTGTIDGIAMDCIISEGNNIEFNYSINGEIFASIDPKSIGLFSYYRYDCASALCGYAVKQLIRIDENSEPDDPYPIKPVTYKVTFRVENGKWNDNTTEDKIVKLDGTTADTITITEEDIPAVGNVPSEGYHVGSWDTLPYHGIPVTGDITYTYTYEKDHDPVSYTVTFKVANGSWTDGTTDDKIVRLDGTVADILTLSEQDIPLVGDKPAEDYEEGSWDVEPNTETQITEDTTYIYIYKEIEPDIVSYLVTFRVANGYWNDDTIEDKSVVLEGTSSDILTLNESDIPEVGNHPDEGYEIGSWDVEPNTETLIASNKVYTYSYAEIEQPEPEPEETI